MGSVFIKRNKKGVVKDKISEIKKKKNTFIDSALPPPSGFFSKYRKIIFGVLFFVIFCLLAWGVWFELSHSREETFVFKNVRTVAIPQVVAGLPVKMVTLVDVNEIKDGKKFVKIPKSATDITVKKITPQEIRDLKKVGQTSITAEQRLSIIKQTKTVAKVNFSKNFLGSLLQGVNSFLADDTQAVQYAVSAIVPDVNSQLVDVSNPAPAETPTETPAPTPTPAPAISVPTINNILPTTGTTAGGDTVTITGSEFVTGATVTIGGASATVTNVSADGTTITATTPTGTAGTADVVVTNTDTGVVTLSGGFTYVAPIISLTPESSSSLTETTSPSNSAVAGIQTPSPTPTPTPTPVQQPCQGDATDNCIAVAYTLPAPVITSQATDTGQLVTVSAPGEDPNAPLVDVIASTKIPKIFKVGEEE